MTRFSSLKSTIVLRLIIPVLLFIIIIECLFSFFVTRHYINESYDRWLLSSARSLEQEIKVSEGKVSARLSDSALKIFKWDDAGTTYFNIQTEHGGILVGDLPVREFTPDQSSSQELFRNIYLNGEHLRMVSLKASGELPSIVYINVAETLNRRHDSFISILVTDLAPQILLTLVIGALLYKGVNRGLAPLNRLTRNIADRSPTDLSPLPDDDIYQEVMVLTDTINHLFAKLDDSISAQQRFISNAAHQLRTPLAGLKLQAERAQRENSIDTMRPALAQIQQSADRITHMINQLLLLARSDQIEGSHAFQQIDLLALCKDICMEWVPKALEKDIAICFEDKAEHFEVNGDPVLLTELISNLIDNAINYGNPHGTILVTVQHTPSPMVIIEDDGPGISPQQLEKVFERFYRIPGTAGKGCGLGLAIVKEIADLHRIDLRLGQSGLGGVKAELRCPVVVKNNIV